MIKKINETPTFADIVELELPTPDSNGCYLNDPYQIDSLKIYYIQKTFGGNDKLYEKKIYDEKIKKELDDAVLVACNNPTEENLEKVNLLKDKFNKTIKTESFYFSSPKTVKIIGDIDNPAWLSTNPTESQITHVEVDENGSTQYGKFVYYWNATGSREGDYIVCWTWKPNPFGDSLSSHFHFTLFSNTQITTSIPTHFTNNKKYSTLLERYLPTTFKNKISGSDITPKVINEFNESIAKGFTFLEDQTNQIVDLLDANSTHETLLPHLGNLFDISLYTEDPTLWRRQIKNAIPLFKKKGTLNALKEALSQAGVKLTRFAQMWQCNSNYTWQESFEIKDSISFELSKTMITPLDINNTEVYYLQNTSSDWVQLTTDYINISNNIITWIGDNLSYNPIELSSGDFIRIIYKINEIPSEYEQNIENYLRSLPLLDNRDVREQDYPPNNWNTRLIEEDDPMFSSIITEKHPFVEKLIYGWVRTEFPYSENIYNMDEYNGMKFESTNPCDIDKSFIDSCKSCLSSKYSLDLEIENLSNDKLIEISDLIKENTPFHSILHEINLSNAVNEFITPPVENINFLINYNIEEFNASGNIQMIFNRLMLGPDQFKRNELALTEVVYTGTGTGYNENIMIYSLNNKFNDIGINNDYNILEILSPSVHSGLYKVNNYSSNFVKVVDTLPSEPLDESSFTFILSNERLLKTNSIITQNNLIEFSEDNQNFIFDNIKTQLDGSPWKIYINDYATSYEIINILPNGTLIIDDPSYTLPSLSSNTEIYSNLSYILRDNNDNDVYNSLNGKLTIKSRATISLSGSVLINGSSVNYYGNDTFFNKYHEKFNNHYVLMNGNQYLITGYPNDDSIYIEGYYGGDASGVEIKILKRLLNNESGNFQYFGIKLDGISNLENSLGINNGENPISVPLEDNSFKENFLILIDTEYFSINNIDENMIYLSGPHKTWGTTGTSVEFNVIRYTKNGLDILPNDRKPKHDGYSFDQIDRRGYDIITIEDQQVESLSALSASAINSEGPVDCVSQRENIQLIIEKV